MILIGTRSTVRLEERTKLIFPSHLELNSTIVFCFDEYICDYGDHIIGDYLHRVQYGTLSGSSAERMANCLKDPILRNYIMTFLARIFYNATGYAAINHGCGPYSQLTNSMFAAIDNL